MDAHYSNSFARTIRVVASNGGAFIQIKDDKGKELGSIVLNADDLQHVFDMVNRAIGIVE